MGEKFRTPTNGFTREEEKIDANPPANGFPVETDGAANTDCEVGGATAGVIAKVAVATALAGIPGKTAIAFTVAFEVKVNGPVYSVEPMVGTLPLVV